MHKRLGCSVMGCARRIIRGIAIARVNARWAAMIVSAQDESFVPHDRTAPP